MAGRVPDWVAAARIQAATAAGDCRPPEVARAIDDGADIPWQCDRGRGRVLRLEAKKHFVDTIEREEVVEALADVLRDRDLPHATQTQLLLDLADQLRDF